MINHKADELMVVRLGIFAAQSLNEMRRSQNLVTAALEYVGVLHKKGNAATERMCLEAVADDLVARGFIEYVPPRYALTEAGKDALKGSRNEGFIGAAAMLARTSGAHV